MYVITHTHVVQKVFINLNFKNGCQICDSISSLCNQNVIEYFPPQIMIFKKYIRRKINVERTILVLKG